MQVRTKTPRPYWKAKEMCTTPTAAPKPFCLIEIVLSLPENEIGRLGLSIGGDVDWLFH